jgi:hypothetical protein
MWLYNGLVVEEDILEGYVGFVYLITNQIDGRKYIGKKILKNRRRVKVKAKTRRKTKITDSNWREYYGSSPSLSTDIDKLGIDIFTREILHLCKTKSDMAYLEAKEQFSRGCLETHDYYNEHIMVRVRKANLKCV